MRISDCSSDVCSCDLRVDDALRARDARDCAHAGLCGQAQVGPVLPAAVEHGGALVAQRAQQEPQPRGKCAVAIVVRDQLVRGGDAPVAQARVEVGGVRLWVARSEGHTSELQSLMRNSYAVFCLEKQTNCYTTQ